MMQKFSNIPVFCTVGLAVLGGYKAIDVKPEVEPKGRVAGLNAHETHASASLLGQFRTSVSGWLWVRTRGVPRGCEQLVIYLAYYYFVL